MTVFRLVLPARSALLPTPAPQARVPAGVPLG